MRQDIWITVINNNNNNRSSTTQPDEAIQLRIRSTSSCLELPLLAVANMAMNQNSTAKYERGRLLSSIDQQVTLASDEKSVSSAFNYVITGF